MSKQRKYFIIQINSDLQNKMRLAKSSHGVNWGFVLRDAIQEYLSRVEKESTTD